MAPRKYAPPLAATEYDRGDYHRQALRSELVDLRHDIARLTARVRADLERIRAVGR